MHTTRNTIHCPCPALCKWVFLLGVGSLMTGASTGAATHTTDADPVEILSNATASMTLSVPDSLPIADINVTVMINHTYDDDLIITMVHPDGTTVLLANRRGGANDHYRATTFDDEAGQSISAGAPPFRGSFRPEEPLSRLDGKSTLGTWRLRVQDVVGGDEGEILCFSLTINGSTYVSTAVPRDIPDHGFVASTVVVNNAFVVGDAEVTVDIAHECVHDLILTLRHPDGTEAELVNRIDQCDDDYACTTFDDQAPVNIAGGEAPYRGRWTTQSGSALAAFNGRPSNGTWTLIVRDEAFQDIGTLNDWWLNLSSEGFGPDLCPDAIPLTLGIPHTNTNVGAGGVDITSCGVNDARDVWHSWTAPRDMVVKITLCGSAFNTTLAVFDGCPSPDGSGVELACNDDNIAACGSVNGSQISVFEALVDRTYYIRVAGSNNQTGTYTIEVALANDDCTDPIPIAGGTYPFSNVGATTDGPDEPEQCFFFGYSQVGSDIWYCYEALCNGTATVSLCGSDYDTKLAVYDGCACPPMAIPIACNDDSCGTQSQVSFGIDAGHSYLIRVGGYQAAQGNGVLSLTTNPVHLCGNGVVEPCEQCDPPNGVTCDDTCRTIGGVCGNGVVEPGEDCDPPDGVTCDDGCHYLPCDPLTLLGARSVANHQTGEFYIPLDISGNPALRTCESRSHGIRILDFLFDQAILSGSISINGAPSHAMTLLDNGMRGRVVLAQALANGAVYSISISARTGARPECELLTEICVVALAGDFNEDESVTATDKAQLVGFFGQTVNQRNARYDVHTGNGSIINVDDISFWSLYFGNSVVGMPCP